MARFSLIPTAPEPERAILVGVEWRDNAWPLDRSLDELERRLCARATDSAETIARRVAAAREEMRHVAEFDYVIINDDLQRALQDLLAVVRAERLRYAAQRQRHPILFEATTR